MAIALKDAQLIKVSTISARVLDALPWYRTYPDSGDDIVIIAELVKDGCAPAYLVLVNSQPRRMNTMEIIRHFGRERLNRNTIPKQFDGEPILEVYG
jgi:hypothetical protein